MKSIQQGGPIMKKKSLFTFLMAISCLLYLAGCSNNTTETTSSNDTDTTITEDTATDSDETAKEDTDDKAETATESEATTSLSGHTLSIFCGAGMTKPFQEIADQFKSDTDCEMEITFANAGQIQTQINTAQEGDLFIAGSADEVKPVQDVVTASKDLVKHIPVLAVKSDNPLEITGLSDLANENVRVVLGDFDSTPIGKIADKALTDIGILDQVNVVARTTTAPAIFNALTMDECDAIIVWKENVTDDSIKIVETTDLDKYIKTIPAASLSYCDDQEALTAFLAFLDSDAAHNIWISYGYEIIQ